MIRDDVRVFVEGDCLGHWCGDSTARVQEFFGLFGASVRMIGEAAQVMNDNYTQEIIDAIDPEVGRERPRVNRPSAGIPSQVLASLAAERALGSRQWPALADRVAQVAQGLEATGTAS